MIFKFADAARFVSLFAFCFAFFTMGFVLLLTATAVTASLASVFCSATTGTFDHSERPAGSRTRYVPFGKGTLYR